MIELFNEYRALILPVLLGITVYAGLWRMCIRITLKMAKEIDKGE